MSCLQHTQQLLLSQTQTVRRVEQQLHTLREQHQVRLCWFKDTAVEKVPVLAHFNHFNSLICIALAESDL